MSGVFIMRLGFWWLLVVAGGASGYSADDKKDVNPTAPKTADTAAGDTDAMSSFCRLLPLGQKSINVKIPSFKDGRLTSLMTSGTMARVDDDHMEMENMDVLLKGQTEAQDINVKLHVATYDMPTAILSSSQRSLVARSDFQIEGDSLVFDTRTQQGKMVGHVEMIVYDSNTLKGKSHDERKPDEKTNLQPKNLNPAAPTVKTPKKETK